MHAHFLTSLSCVHALDNSTLDIEPILHPIYVHMFTYKPYYIYKHYTHVQSERSGRIWGGDGGAHRLMMQDAAGKNNGSDWNIMRQSGEYGIQIWMVKVFGSGGGDGDGDGFW